MATYTQMKSSDDLKSDEILGNAANQLAAYLSKHTDHAWQVYRRERSYTDWFMVWRDCYGIAIQRARQPDRFDLRAMIRTSDRWEEYRFDGCDRDGLHCTVATRRLQAPNLNPVGAEICRKLLTEAFYTRADTLVENAARDRIDDARRKALTQELNQRIDLLPLEKQRKIRLSGVTSHGGGADETIILHLTGINYPAALAVLEAISGSHQ